MERLLRQRTKLGLTLEELAGRSGVNRDTISELERGKRKPRPSTVSKLANGLGVSFWELVDDDMRRDKEMMKQAEKVAVKVAWRDTDDRPFSETIRFTGTKVDSYEGGDTVYTLFETPPGSGRYLVHEDDPAIGDAELYPRGHVDPRTKVDMYNKRLEAHEVAEGWPGFSDSVGVSRIRDID